MVGVVVSSAKPGVDKWDKERRENGEWLVACNSVSANERLEVIGSLWLKRSGGYQHPRMEGRLEEKQ